MINRGGAKMTHVSDKPMAKAVIREVIEAQPDDASYEEIMRELAFERMIERGLADVRAGRSVSHDEAMRRIRSWQN
jgi:predicted transcriptional regulator